MTRKDRILDLAIQYGFQILGAIAILVVGLMLARWVGKLADRWLVRQELEPPIRMLLGRTVRIVVLLFTVVVALERFGVPVAPLLAGIGIIGLGVGLAVQGVLSNVLAGLTIIFTKPYRVGEYVECLGVYGQVDSITIFSTTLAHADRSRIVIPNRKIIGEILHNYGSIRQLNLSVGVAYGTDLERALTTARKVVETNRLVLKDPLPLVGIAALADSAITISVQPWVRVGDYVVAQADIYKALVEQFREESIEIPFPQHEVRLLTERQVIP
jgi:small conductance mechanosensitive channel